MHSPVKLVLTLILAAVVPLSAATMEAKYEGYHGGTVKMSVDGGSFKTVGGGVFSFKRTGGTYLDGPELNAQDIFYAMCIEPTQAIAAGSTNAWDVRDLAQGNLPARAFSTEQVEALTGLFGMYWPDFETKLNPAGEALSLQVAVWEVVRETEDAWDVYSGAIKFQDVVANTLSRADFMLKSLSGEVPEAKGLMAMVNRSTQDYVFQIDELPPQEVPEPTHLMGLGLLALLALKKRLG